ncbi:MAG: M48 family metallopeptidase [Rickettsiales bacterium]|nr:M48 family metallopeptidase [Rickettsiales bacterium]
MALAVPLTLIRKKIRNIYLRIYPSKEVVVTVPLNISAEKINEFISKKENWIKKSLQKFEGYEYKKPLRYRYETGEEHLFFSKKYILQIVEGKASVRLDGEVIFLSVKKKSTIKLRKKILEDFYRSKLREIIPKYIAEFEPKMQVRVAEFGIKKMKTRWGTCNIRDKRIWLNLELAKKPLDCLKYIVVHEMTHLLEKNHNKRFFLLMDEFLPEWRVFSEILK